MPRRRPTPLPDFLTLPAELRSTIDAHIPNACVHRTLHLPGSENDSSPVTVVTFVPASTIRLTCKGIAHEAKPIVLETANRAVMVEYEQLRANPLESFVIQLNKLRLLTSKGSVLYMAGLWSLALNNMNFARSSKKQQIGDMDEEVLKVIESAGRALYKGQNDINIVIEPGLCSDVIECVREFDTYNALEATSLT
jgi:hypothetical protein